MSPNSPPGSSGVVAQATRGRRSTQATPALCELADHAGGKRWSARRGKKVRDLIKTIGLFAPKPHVIALSQQMIQKMVEMGAELKRGKALEALREFWPQDREMSSSTWASGEPTSRVETRYFPDRKTAPDCDRPTTKTPLEVSRKKLLEMCRTLSASRPTMVESGTAVRLRGRRTNCVRNASLRRYASFRPSLSV